MAITVNTPPGGLSFWDRLAGRQLDDRPDVNAAAKPPVGFQGSDPVRARHRDAALADYGAIQSRLMLDGGDQLTAREHANTKEPSTVWPHGQLIAAALDRALLNGDVDEARKAIAGLERYDRSGTYNPLEGHGAQERYYDDNAWIGLDFAQAFRLTGDQAHIDGARRMFDFLQEGMHREGGLYWKENQSPPARATASNGPALQLALQLHDLTGEQKYMDAAKQLDAFITRDLRRGDGLLIDNVSDTGKRDGTIFSYNQGTVIGADVQFYEKTGDRTYLERAKSTASAALDDLATDDRLWKQAPAFNAVFFRNLMQLDRIAPDPRIRQTLERYLERAGASGRNADGLYEGAGMGGYDAKPGAGTAMIDQAAFVQMHALLAMTPEQLRTVS